MGKEEVVHLPEFALQTGRQRRLARQGRVGMRGQGRFLNATFTRPGDSLRSFATVASPRAEKGH